eukprot:GFKZ01002333.1.p1 GENE.GFKZ01002333.1~~GFKZ01002333.1.p1  ORF type:complete len:432 (-),score=46.89 GFKZ01002333.1:597-1892(-)
MKPGTRLTPVGLSLFPRPCTRNIFECPHFTYGQSLLQNRAHGLHHRMYSKSRRSFVDRTVLSLNAGNGGSGCVSFACGPHQEIAPADGGHGGAGGSVWVEATTDCNSLRMSSKSFQAAHGCPGRSDKRRGRQGGDLVIKVPPGTVIRELNVVEDEEPFEMQFKITVEPYDERKNSEFGEGVTIAELSREGQRAIIARGGVGGRGNSAFKSSRNRSPQTAEPGSSGERRRVELELKTIADVGLVGFPNAGKSTFLRAISRAKPKVASYPFTTLRPHIGVVPSIVDDGRLKDRTLTVADIPGLIEGAHENRGLGHEFLRHIERTKFLVYVLDLSVSRGQVVKDWEVLRHELELHEEGMSERMCCIAANKMDCGQSSYDNLRILLDSVGDSVPIFPLSAERKTGTEAVVKHLSASVLRDVDEKSENQILEQEFR